MSAREHDEHEHDEHEHGHEHDGHGHGHGHGHGEEEEPGRRLFLKQAIAAVGGTALVACTRAPDKVIVPYAKGVPEMIPGVASHYATALAMDGYATGVIATCREGRPIKIEGNPAHSASLGATSAIEQAATLALYDPQRAKEVLRDGAPSSFGAFQEAVLDGIGDRVHFVLEPTSSPTIAALVPRVRARLPRATFHWISACGRRSAWEGARLAFGQVADVVPRLDRADVVVALDADLLDAGPHHLAFARAFASRRKVRSTADGMSRLYVVEPSPTATGIASDHRLPLRRGDVPAIAAALFHAVAGGLAPAWGGAPSAIAAALATSTRPSLHREFVDAVARDLLAHRGRAVVVAGEAQPPHVHALAHAITALVGGVRADGTLEAYPSPILDAGAPSHDPRPLLDALDRGEVDALVVVGANLAYALPGDADFAARMRKARERVVLASHEDETAAEATWLVPEAHPLEAWGDVRALDGTTSIAQPMIAPLFGGKSAIELLATFAGVRDAKGYDLVRDEARGALGDRFEEAWEQALAHGVLSPPVAPLPVGIGYGFLGDALRADAVAPLGEGELELAIDPDPRLRDGRHANVPWLLELPEPVTKLTWDNALKVAPSLASKLGLETSHVVELRVGGRAVKVPVIIVPGQAEHALALSLGWGRRRGAPHAEGHGVDVNPLRTLASPWSAHAIAITKTDEVNHLAITQPELSMHDRPIALHKTLDEYQRDPRFAEKHRKSRPTLYRLPLEGKHQWAMTIDLSLCTGCSACMVACQAENDVPHVGKDGVLVSREMHWIRIDRYVEESEGEHARTRVQPMLCQHCEKAPCEYVCPVNATVHSPDGLNEQVYNRCIGTRFCSNNCPYKVRRFNFFDYHEDETEPLLLVHNPDVTVRARGVMEKCTYCVQRIRRAEIQANLEHRALKDGDVVTACAQACPTRAIVFGDMRDPRAEIHSLRENERAYAVLDELATEPRTRYLARLDNPNPELGK